MSRVGRWMMVMNDFNPENVTGTYGRQNVALYFAPPGAPRGLESAALAFAPGVGLSGIEERAMYPQMWQFGDALAGNSSLAVIWSSGVTPRSIRTAWLPLPNASKYTLAIRNNTGLVSARPVPHGTYLAYFGAQSLQTRRPILFDSGERKFTAGCWFRLDDVAHSSALLDARQGSHGGLLLGVHSSAGSVLPYVFLGMGSSKTSDANITPPNTSNMSAFCTQAVGDRVWLYFGFVVDTDAGTATFIAARGDTGALTHEVVAFNPLARTWNLSSFPDNATVGNKNSPSQARSSVRGLDADLAALALVSGALTLDQVCALANEQGSSIGTAPLKPLANTSRLWSGGESNLVAEVQDRVVFWLNGTDEASALQRSFPLPPPTSQDQPLVTRGGGTSVRLCQSSSAGMELPVVTCRPKGPALHTTMRFKLHRGATSTAVRPTPQLPYRWTVATVGDGEAHVRVVAEQTGPSPVGARLHMRCSRGGDNASVRLNSVALMEWTSIDITSAAGAVSVNGSAPLFCGCTMGGVWAFLGEGYLHRPYAYATECVEHSLEGLVSRAERVTDNIVVGHTSSESLGYQL